MHIEGNHMKRKKDDANPLGPHPSAFGKCDKEFSSPSNLAQHKERFMRIPIHPCGQGGKN